MDNDGLRRYVLERPAAMHQVAHPRLGAGIEDLADQLAGLEYALTPDEPDPSCRSRALPHRRRRRIVTTREV